MGSLDNKACLKILHQEKVPIHIIRHCVKVSSVSCKIAYNLLRTGYKLDIDLIRAGALLHDVAKMKALRHGGDHAEMGARLLEAMGYDKIGEVIRQHVFLRPALENLKGLNEELVVNYADKRVMHTRIVSLEERFSDLVERYGKDRRAKERINELYLQTRLMEQRIFEKLDIGPEDI